MKLGLEALTGRSLSVWLEFISETGEKAFCLQVQIKSCINLRNEKKKKKNS